MRRRGLCLRLAAGVAAAGPLAPLAGCDPAGGLAFAPAAVALPRLPTDPRVAVAPGAEPLAILVAGALPRALDQVEAFCGAAYLRPPEIRVFASEAAFEAEAGLPRGSGAGGATQRGTVRLAPRLLVAPKLLPGLLTHELTHAWFDQRLSNWASRRLPAWFQEGVAVAASDGGGAESVGEREAMAALRAGHRFTPEASTGWLETPHAAPAFGLSHHMFYRQAGMFIAWLRAGDRAGFARMLALVAAGDGLAAGFAGGLRTDVAAAWAGFLGSLR